MADELESIASVEPDEPAIEQEVEVEQPTSPDEEETEIEGIDPDDDDDDNKNDDLEEFDWNGQKVKGPKGLKDGVLMQADYTKKTQDIAATRKELEERAQRIEQQAAAGEEEIQHRATMHTIESELARFKEFDWNAYQQARQVDPFAADEAWNYVQHLRAQKADVGAKISEAEQRRSSEAQQEFAKRMNETQQYARSKGYSPEIDKQILDFAFQKGATPQKLQSVMSPLVYEMLYLARIGEQALKKVATPPKPASAPVAPLQVVAAKASPPARKSLGEMSMEEYVAARKAGRG